jgi:hypothetical protein
MNGGGIQETNRGVQWTWLSTRQTRTADEKRTNRTRVLCKVLRVAISANCRAEMAPETGKQQMNRG